MLDAGNLQRDVVQAPDDFLGALDGGRIGQLHDGDQVLLVLRRHEARRHQAEHEYGETDQQHVDAERDAAMAQHAADAAAVAPRSRS